MVAELMEADAVDPGLELATAIEIGETGPSGDPDLLQDVIYMLGDDALGDETTELRLMEGHEIIKCDAVSVDGGRDEPRVSGK